MKRSFVILCLVLTLTIPILSADVTAATNNPTLKAPAKVVEKKVAGVRIVVDGHVNTVNALQYKGDWYLTPKDISTILNVKMAVTYKGYASLSLAAKKKNVSYEYDPILNAAYVWTEETYSKGGEIDYSRAIALGLVSEEFQKNSERTITPKEFGKLLTLVINRTDATKLKEFEKNVAPALASTRPMRRGEGFVMAYYAAESIGAGKRNNDFDHTVIPTSRFWDTNGLALEQLFPNVMNGPVSWNDEGGDKWQNYFTAAFLWTAWHSSPTSGAQVFEYDSVKNTMGQTELLTVHDAVCAAVRIYDSFAGPTKLAALNSSDGLNYDKSIITKELLSKAQGLKEVRGDNPPVWNGFVLSNGGYYEVKDITVPEKELRNIANWGFNSVRYMVTYQTLFDEKVHSVNLNNMRKLDEIIAKAIKYNLHVDLLTYTLPGRWAASDPKTFVATGEFDLFTNMDRQKEAKALWEVLAERYKDIPSATLSFCPIWEAQNYTLSSGLSVTPYTEDDVASVYNMLLNTIKKKDPDRFVIYEPTPANSAETIIAQSGKIRSTILSSHPDALMMANFCENPFVYAEMTAVEGANIDTNNHSMFKPGYPTTIYAVQRHISNEEPLLLDGELVKGTKLNIYLSKVEGSGKFEILADGQSLYKEQLDSKTYSVEPPLSGYYPYAKSEKAISVLLPSDFKELQVKFNGSWFEWSGMDVTLPAKYAVKRWWFMSGYDAMLSGQEHVKPTLKTTSNIMISPNSYEAGRKITIRPDVTFETPVISAESNKRTIEEWAQSMAKFSPKMIIRFENATFNIGTINDAALKYYEDLLTIFEKYGFGWYSNDYTGMVSSEYSYAGSNPVKYKGLSLNVELLKLLQKHQKH